MSAALVSFLFTVGASAWIFTKLQNRSGGNTKQSTIATAFIAVIMFFVLLSILNRIF